MTDIETIDGAKVVTRATTTEDLRAEETKGVVETVTRGVEVGAVIPARDADVAPGLTRPTALRQARDTTVEIHLKTRGRIRSGRT